MNIVDAQLDSLAPGTNAFIGLPDEDHSAFLHGPMHLSLDLDLRDPALTPGTFYCEPGSLAAPTVVRLIQKLRAPSGGTDTREYIPWQDVQPPRPRRQV